MLPDMRDKNEVAQVAASAFKTDADRALASTSRLYRDAWVRHVILWAVVQAGFSTREVAEWAGRDRGTIDYAVKRVDDARDVYKEVKAATDEILQKVN